MGGHVLGWHISVYRQAEGGASPASWGDDLGARLAVWQGPVGALGWIKALLADQRAVMIGGNGYPFQYSARVVDIRQTILDAPPLAHEHWRAGVDDVLDER